MRRQTTQRRNAASLTTMQLHQFGFGFSRFSPRLPGRPECNELPCSNDMDSKDIGWDVGARFSWLLHGKLLAKVGVP